jgi:4-amino-4-deoxy-L-arabinose transferase-like glycosyltransferase
MYVISPAIGVPAYRSFFGLPLLISQYVGADKSWIYPPIFALFGVNALSIRLPAILISCGTLALGYVLVRRIWTPRWALIFTMACAVHPGFIFLTKVDWGPIVIMLFLKALCLILLFRWLEGPRRICWLLFGLCALGFLDKFNFVWLVVALLFATPAIYGAEVLRKLRSIPVGILVTVAIGAFAAGLVRA